RADPGDRPQRSHLALGPGDQSRRGRDRPRPRRGSARRTCPRPAPRHPNPVKRQYRHRGQDGDDRRRPGPRRRAPARGLDDRAAAAPGGRGHPWQGLDERVGVLQVDAQLERLERPERPGAQSLRAQPHAVRVVLLYAFKAAVNAYLSSVAPGAHVRTLDDVIQFNKRNARENLPYFGQELLERAQAKGELTEAEYLEALDKCRRLAGKEGLDAVMDGQQLDALIAPTTTPAWPVDLVNGDQLRGSSAKSAALVGYPLVSVPACAVSGLPVGITFMGRAWSEPTLIKLA